MHAVISLNLSVKRIPRIILWLIEAEWRIYTYVGRISPHFFKDNGVSSVRRQAIIQTTAGLLLIASWDMYFDKILQSSPSRKLSLICLQNVNFFLGFNLLMVG